MHVRDGGGSHGPLLDVLAVGVVAACVRCASIMALGVMCARFFMVLPPAPCVPAHAALLEMPVMDYMQHIRLTQNTSARTTKALVIAIPSTATFMDAATKLDVLHVHRCVCEEHATVKHSAIDGLHKLLAWLKSQWW